MNLTTYNENDMIWKNWIKQLERRVYNIYCIESIDMILCDDDNDYNFIYEI